ncbi:MAG: XkdX family protein [Clostridium sp.]|uniref:XkdX family protein n=1 Tax=Clostridia TaxID=186801 RepID=UPI003F2DD2DA
MDSTNYDFWKMAYDMKAIDEGMLRQAVLTKENPYGEITPEQFKVITGKGFITSISDTNTQV